VYAFEPLPSHVKIVEYNIAQNLLGDRITVISAGVGSESNQVAKAHHLFSQVTHPGFQILGNEDQFPVVSIDDYVDESKISKIDFIKMDIEGFEIAALKGAAKTIEHFSPKLAISLYHKWDDFFTIPLFLKEKYPFYKFYLDHHTIHGEETVLYVCS
jgi:FkbM family methyltransferase